MFINKTDQNVLVNATSQTPMLSAKSTILSRLGRAAFLVGAAVNVCTEH